MPCCRSPHIFKQNIPKATSSTPYPLSPRSARLKRHVPARLLPGAVIHDMPVHTWHSLPL